MTPETAEHLDKARTCLAKARNLLDILHYNDEAGRAAYPAGHHAAQAFVSERTGKIAKTHEGVHSQFDLLTRRDTRVDSGLRRFLSQAYSPKAIADYEAGSNSIVPVERAEAALHTAA
ncbi:MAG TPA: HEPN domain-containing protein [Rhizomicrobium sp.]|nr:HEPN domain-containing protein [Rhizomicrobium sp.]